MVIKHIISPNFLFWVSVTDSLLTDYDAVFSALIIKHWKKWKECEKKLNWCVFSSNSSLGEAYVWYLLHIPYSLFMLRFTFEKQKNVVISFIQTMRLWLKTLRYCLHHNLFSFTPYNDVSHNTWAECVYVLAIQCATTVFCGTSQRIYEWTNCVQMYSVQMIVKYFIQLNCVANFKTVHFYIWRSRKNTSISKFYKCCRPMTSNSSSFCSFFLCSYFKWF